MGSSKHPPQPSLDWPPRFAHRRSITMLKKLLGWIYLGVSGWRPEGDIPTRGRFVLIAAPHTSNWDLPHTLAIAWATGVEVRWMGKQSLFRFPFGVAMRALGGIPIDRSRHHNVVTAAAELIRQSERILMAVPAEGTRSGGDQAWRSGFYHIAREADVPILLGFLDYSRRRGGLGPRLRPSGDLGADMDVIRAFYRPTMAKFPDKFRMPRLRAEGGEEPGEAR